MSVFPIACDRESKAEAPDTPERLSIKDPFPKGQQKQKGIYLNMNLIFKYELLCMCKSNLPCHTYSPLVLVKEKHSFHHDYRQSMSASGNTILGKPVFKFHHSSVPLTTQCQTEDAQISVRSLTSQTSLAKIWRSEPKPLQHVGSCVARAMWCTD